VIYYAFIPAFILIGFMLGYLAACVQKVRSL
jgi:hypothetical protein